MAISLKNIMNEIKMLFNEGESLDEVYILEIDNNLIESIKWFKC